MTKVILCKPQQKNDVKKSLEKNGVKPQQKVKKFLDIRKSKNVFMSYRKSVKADFGNFVAKNDEKRKMK